MPWFSEQTGIKTRTKTISFCTGFLNETEYSSQNEMKLTFKHVVTKTFIMIWLNNLSPSEKKRKKWGQLLFPSKISEQMRLRNTRGLFVRSDRIIWWIPWKFRKCYLPVKTRNLIGLFDDLRITLTTILLHSCVKWIPSLASIIEKQRIGISTENWTWLVFDS